MAGHDYTIKLQATSNLFAPIVKNLVSSGGSSVAPTANNEDEYVDFGFTGSMDDSFEKSEPGTVAYDRDGNKCVTEGNTTKVFDKNSNTLLKVTTNYLGENKDVTVIHDIAKGTTTTFVPNKEGCTVTTIDKTNGTTTIVKQNKDFQCLSRETIDTNNNTYSKETYDPQGRPISSKTYIGTTSPGKDDKPFSSVDYTYNPDGSYKVVEGGTVLDNQITTSEYSASGNITRRSVDSNTQSLVTEYDGESGRDFTTATKTKETNVSLDGKGGVISSTITQYELAPPIYGSEKWTSVPANEETYYGRRPDGNPDVVAHNVSISSDGSYKKIIINNKSQTYTTEKYDAESGVVTSETYHGTAKPGEYDKPFETREYNRNTNGTSVPN